MGLSYLYDPSKLLNGLALSDSFTAFLRCIGLRIYAASCSSNAVQYASSGVC